MGRLHCHAASVASQPSEKADYNADVAFQISVQREDGMKAVVMDTGVPLATLLEQEEASSKGMFHVPHR